MGKIPKKAASMATLPQSTKRYRAFRYCISNAGPNPLLEVHEPVPVPGTSVFNGSLYPDYKALDHLIVVKHFLSGSHWQISLSLL